MKAAIFEEPGLDNLKVIDYVIIHELCHFLIKDHSHRYWSLLKAYVNDYKRKIEWLDINGKYLLSPLY